MLQVLSWWMVQSTRRKSQIHKFHSAGLMASLANTEAVAAQAPAISANVKPIITKSKHKRQQCYRF